MTKDSISNHLLELRSRLLKVIVLFVALSILGIPFAADIYSFIAAPLLASLPESSSMIATEVASPFMAPIKLVFYVALLFSMPWLFFQIWMFIAPGLYESERRFTAPLMISTILLFFLRSKLCILCSMSNYIQVFCWNGSRLNSSHDRYKSVS
jgi:sec-independent protein translocase protein TatC